MTGSVQPKNGKFYIVLYYIVNGVGRCKRIKTGIDIKENKKKAEALIPELKKICVSGII